MAVAHTNTTYSAANDKAGWMSRLGAHLHAAMTTYIESRARTEQIERLNAKSDEELAKLGITRAGIPAYVFRDHFYI